MKLRTLSLCASLFALCGCGSSAPAASESETSSDTLESSSVSLESSSFESSPIAPGQGAWSLTSEAIPSTKQSQYNLDFDFEVVNGLGQVISFHGDYLQRGSGSKDGASLDGTIQMKKEVSYFYMTGGSASHVEFDVVRIASTYGGSEHDFTGIPTVYGGGDDLNHDNGTEVTLQKEVNQAQGWIHYSFDLGAGQSRFRLENASANALYIVSVNNLA